MTLFAGVDVGSTYTKAALITDAGELVATGIRPTGFRLEEAAREALDDALATAESEQAAVRYLVSTGYGRSQVSFRDLQATDLTAQSWGTRLYSTPMALHSAVAMSMSNPSNLPSAVV